jgi:cysteine-rich repeat protein
MDASRVRSAAWLGAALAALWLLVAVAPGRSGVPHVCGDGVVEGPETCDDSNTGSGDGCDAACQLECGNGNLDAGEDCDDGNTVSGDDCEPDCTFWIVAPPDPAQAACVNAVNENLAGVLKARGGDDAACVKSVAAGKSDLATCYGNDLKEKVAKAGAKTTATIGKKCSDPNEIPTYAFTDAATLNGAGNQAPEDAFAVVFGATPSVVARSADRAGAACQAEVLKQLGALTRAWIGEANKAKKSAFEGGKGGNPPPVEGPGELAAAIDAAVAGSTKLAKAESKANTGIAKKCTDAQVDALFDCSGATTVNGLTLCVIAAGKQAACNALETADALELDCPSSAAP